MKETRHSHWRGAASSALVSRSRAMPVGGRRSAVRLAGRSVVGAGFALPRDAGRRPPPGELAGAPLRAPPCLERYAPRWEPSRRLGPAPPRPCGPLCRPEVGVPLRPAPSGPVGVPRGAAFSQQRWGGTHIGRAPRHRRGFRAPARCRSEAPAGRTGQRSASRAIALTGPRRDGSHPGSWGLRRRGPAFQVVLRFCSGGVTQCPVAVVG